MVHMSSTDASKCKPNEDSHLAGEEVRFLSYDLESEGLKIFLSLCPHVTKSGSISSSFALLAFIVTLIRFISGDLIFALSVL